MNYALTILQARQERDAAIERARAEARQLITEAVETRDCAIWTLHAEDPSLTYEALAGLVGCAQSTVHYVLVPDARESYRQRDRDHLRLVRDRAA